MAEVAVISLIAKIIPVLDALGTHLQHLAKPLQKIHRKMTNIKKELEVMKGFLKDAEVCRGDKRQVVLGWVQRIRDVAYDIEDIVDKYTYLMGGQTTIGLWSFISIALKGPKVFDLNDLADQLDSVEDSLNGILRMKIMYDIKILPDQAEEDKLNVHLAESAHFVKEDELVGAEDKKELLIKCLTNEEVRRTIIYFLGMGGVGKTTIVTAVYKAQPIISHFSQRAWVSVSQNYSVEGLLRKVLAELYKERAGEMTNDINSMDRLSLVETLHALLHKNRYLIILDDVWHANVWNYISYALVNHNCGSRVVITTRNREAIPAAADSVIKLEPLNQVNAWNLFCKRAFPAHEGNKCPQELEDCGRRMVEKCDGLPFAIVALANLLQHKERVERIWNNVLGSLSWSDSENAELHRVSDILSFSIKDLPYHLRSCLLYCSVFPEDYHIARNKLIRFWVAEGFVKERGESTAEEVAEDYVHQLVCRSLLQVTETNESGRVKFLRVHDLVRDLIVTISREENFVQVYDHNLENLTDQVRRLSITKPTLGADEILSSNMPVLRSFHTFASNIPTSLISNCRLLRVLDLSYTQVESLPDEITEFFNLHYLSIRRTMVRQLPNSIGKLRKLETLDALLAYVEDMPTGITKLENLRHLMAKKFHRQTSRYTVLGSGVNVPGAIWNLKKLQTLKAVIANETIVQNLGKMTQIRSLDIRGVRTIHSVQLFTSITKMQRLLRLTVMVRYRDDELQLRTFSVTPPELRKLSLYGKLEKQVLPQFFCSLSELTHLVLKMSRLSESSISSLLALPKLVSLFLMQAYEGESLCFNEGSLPKLRSLVLCDMVNLSCIKIEKRALEDLQELAFVRCNKLKTIPEGIENFTNLQKLELEDMPKELIETLRETNLQNITMIKNWNCRDGIWVEERLS